MASYLLIHCDFTEKRMVTAALDGSFNVLPPLVISSEIDLDISQIWMS